MEGAYECNIFINCPFDGRYRKLFEAIVFAVQDCGFFARCALETVDGGEERLRKIKRIIRECRFGIHDLSRVQLNPETGLPRFNMPLELGLFLGAQEYGTGIQKQKRCLVLDTEQHRYRDFCSDLAGQDIRAHHDEPAWAIAAVRAMLATALGEARLPGGGIIYERFTRFLKELPELCRELHVRPPEIQFPELRSVVQNWLKHHPL